MVAMRGRRALLTVVMVIATMAFSTSVLAAPSRGQVLWGATISGPAGAGDPPLNWAAQTGFERQSAGGKRASLIHFGTGLGSNPAFPADLFRITRSHGAIPFFSWSTYGPTNRQIANGEVDDDIRNWARGAAAWGHPFFVRLAWEMNGSWFPWGVGANGNSAADYVAMWRHVHDLARRYGARNATWVWCPNIDIDGSFPSLRSLYPGARYVDWTCLDAYNSGDPWREFAPLLTRSYDQITKQIAPGKPMVIAETASTEHGGDKGRWIQELFAALPRRFPNVRAFMWFERPEPGLFSVTDWTLGSSPAASAAFAAGIAAPRYASNRFGSIKGHPIRPPG